MWFASELDIRVGKVRVYMNEFLRSLLYGYLTKKSRG
jgi:hypothetical protein